jgi:hypothetical protein
MSFSKLEINLLRDAGIVREVFTHVTMGTFDIKQMRERIQRETVASGRVPPLHRCRFDNMKMTDGRRIDVLSYLMQQREIDLLRCSQLTDEELKDPLIYVLCPPGSNGDGVSHLLIDGIHRMVERHRRGFPDIVFYLIPLRDAVMVDMSTHTEVEWGDKSLVPGVGLVKRKVD